MSLLPNLDSMTDEEKLAALESIHNSINQSKEIQKKKVAENVNLVLQALKRIEADMLERVQGSAQLIENRVNNIKDGKDGINGRDGKDGKDGRPGRDGKDGRNGRDGLPGLPGADGQDGVGVFDAHIDFDGSLIITLTNGNVINVGEVVAPDLAESIKVISNGGGTSQGVLDTLTSLQAQITALQNLGATSYQGTWDASTNTPTITSSVGTKGYYYVVSVAGSTSINSETRWGVGDWIIFNGSTWQKVDGGSTGNLTDLTVSNSLTLSGLTASTALALDASKNVVSVTNTGSGNNVLATSPTLVTPVLGTPTSVTLTNATGLPLSTGVTGTLPTTNGGTGLTSFTANGVVYASSTSALATGSALTFDGTNLGVNVATPGAKVDIANGNVRVTIAAASFSQLGLQTRYSSGFSTLAAGQGSDGTAYLINNHNASLAFGVNATEGMRLTSTGLGIGTTSPSVPLTVKARAADNVGIRVLASSNNSALLQFTDDPVTAARGTLTSTSTYFRVDSNGGYLSLATGGTERAVLDSSGNLGIGTSSPGFKLQVVGASQIQTNAAGTQQVLQLNNSDTTAGTQAVKLGFSSAGTTKASINAAVYGNDYMAFNVGSDTERMRIDSNGNLIVGGTSASARVHSVSSSAGATTYPLMADNAAGGAGVNVVGLSFANGGTTKSSITAAVYGNDYMAFNVNGNTERARIDASGNLGVGTTSPSASAIIDAQSTTKGVRMPNMTTTQKNAISSPAAGLMVFDTTLGKLCVYTGSAWQTITSI